MIIIEEDGRYLWASREGRELQLERSGAYYCFVHVESGSYVKVLDSNELPASMREPGPCFHFMEHAIIGLASFTYWGSTDRFVADPAR